MEFYRVTFHSNSRDRISPPMLNSEAEDAAEQWEIKIAFELGCTIYEIENHGYWAEINRDYQYENELRNSERE